MMIGNMMKYQIKDDALHKEFMKRGKEYLIEQLNINNIAIDF